MFRLFLSDLGLHFLINALSEGGFDPPLFKNA